MVFSVCGRPSSSLDADGIDEPNRRTTSERDDSQGLEEEGTQKETRLEGELPGLVGGAIHPGQNAGHCFA